MFATTYVCEKLFSTMKIVKAKFRSRLTDKYLRDQLRLASGSSSFFWYIYYVTWIHKEDRIANSRKVRNLIDLRQRIIQAVELITPDILVNTWREVEYRFGTCRAINGAHIEA
ncbi:hypothetical protein ANN_21020 [Periplaneta americana]|uniref:HAT C-terminal dimerisation domain-containing protein n=1 Tax=Periplaneta americana TaxID=6978 RepID=A0ABQ8SE81_PERAM|nr:hypothetical protein ANN_21020 [Periplaneta americana]